MTIKRWQGQSKQGQLHRQLPASQPPTAPAPSRPQPLPIQQHRAEVFSTYDALPVAARIFRSTLFEQGVEGEGFTLWTYDITCPQGFVMVIRSIRTYAFTSIDGFGEVPLPLRASVTRNGAAVSFVDQLFIDAGDSINDLFVVVGSGETGGLIASGSGITTTAAMRVTIAGELLRSRGLVQELEIGHEAPFVKVLPLDPGDLIS
jgi:hypothetical protein